MTPRSLLPALPWLLPALAGAQAPAAPAAAASAPNQLERVQVSSGPTANSRRRNSTASKIVIDREELARYGDTQLGDVLRRLPGVTLGGRPGRGGDIRMRGLGGGFTQILIDGERAPAGFSVDQLPPDQVERIEILRAPTAETGARAVAGTINIILREPLEKSANEARAGVGGDHGQPQADFNWTRNGKWGGDKGDEWVGAFSVNGSVQRRYSDIDQRSQTRKLTTSDVPASSDALVAQWSQQGFNLARNANLNANARLRWKLSDTLSISIAPVGFFSRNRSHTDLATTGFARFDVAHGNAASEGATLRLNTSLSWRPAAGETWELRAGKGRSQASSNSRRLEALAGLPVRAQDDLTRTHDDNTTLGGKWSLRTSREHQWVTGWEWEAGNRQQTRSTLEDGAPKPGFEEFGDSLAARTRRLAAYTQDEWAPSKQWSVYFGLRWEQIQTQGDAGGILPATRNTSQVASPLFHLLWKPETWPKDQVRLSLTRSYRAPTLNDLIARPVLSSGYPIGPNPQTSPDRAGNPQLQPELATGLDLSLEHWLPTGGIVSGSAFVRDIRGLIRNLLAQEQVPWDAAMRWVSRPRNLDRARSIGLELEAKARLDEVWGDAPDVWAPLLLRANVAIFSSKVDGIPGPNNRLEQQPRGTFNLGLDYRWRVSGRTVGTGFNWGYVPGGRIQQTPLLQRTDNARRVLDAYLSWNTGELRDGIGWRLSFANLVPYDTLLISQVDSAGLRSVTEDRKHTFAVWNLKGELRF